MANMKIFKGYLVGENGVVYNTQGKPKKPAIQKKTGYQIVTLYYGGHPHTHGVHRLVAELYVPKPADIPDGNMFVEHIDGNRLNNSAANLRWAERQLRLEVMNPSNAVTVIERDGTKRKFDSLTKAAKAYGLTTSAISGYVKGKYHDKTGRRWYYSE